MHKRKAAAFLFCSCPRAIREPMVWPEGAQQGHGSDAAPSRDAPRRSHSRRELRDSQPATAIAIHQFAQPGTPLSGSSGMVILARGHQIRQQEFWKAYPRIRLIAQATGPEDFSSAPHLATARPLLPVPPSSPISPLPPPSPSMRRQATVGLPPRVSEKI